MKDRSEPVAVNREWNSTAKNYRPTAVGREMPLAQAEKVFFAIDISVSRKTYPDFAKVARADAVYAGAKTPNAF